MKKQPSIFVIGLSGESLFFEVDHFNKAGETVIAKALHTEPGGKGFNQAIALSKLGATVHFLTVTGTDDYANVIEEELNRLGVFPHLVKIEGEQSTRACIMTNRLGDNMVCVYPGVSDQVSPDILGRFEDIISTCDFLLMQQEYPISVLTKAIEIAQKHQVKIIINPAPTSLFSLHLLPEAFLITPNESEAKTIFGLDQDVSIDELIDKIKESKFHQIIVTLGAVGSLVYEKGKVTLVPPLRISPNEVLDTTGAGDIYTAAVVYQLGLGIDLVQAANFASVVSSLSVKRKYVLEAVPSQDEIKFNLK